MVGVLWEYYYYVKKKRDYMYYEVLLSFTLLIVCLSLLQCDLIPLLYGMGLMGWDYELEGTRDLSIVGYSLYEYR